MLQMLLSVNVISGLSGLDRDAGPAEDSRRVGNTRLTDLSEEAKIGLEPTRPRWVPWTSKPKTSVLFRAWGLH